MAQTVTSKVLLGFMDEEEALATLTREMVPPISTTAALALWLEHKKKRDKVKDRDCSHPPAIPLTEEEKDWATKHLHTHRGNNTVLDVVKVDARRLLAHQFSLTVDVSDGYKQKMNDPTERIKICLGIGLKYQGRIPKAKKVNGILRKRIPHFEYKPYRFTTDDDLLVQEQERFISVMSVGDRKLLWAGYHRTHSLVACSKPDETDCLLLGTLVADDTGFLGINSTLPHKRSVVRGSAPALICDFFDPDLCMTVTLRKRRFEIHADPKAGAWKYEQCDVE